MSKNDPKVKSSGEPEAADDATYSTEARDVQPDIWTARIRIEDKDAKEPAVADISVGSISFLLAELDRAKKRASAGG